MTTPAPTTPAPTTTADDPGATAAAFALAGAFGASSRAERPDRRGDSVGGDTGTHSHKPATHMSWWERLYIPEIARGLLTTLKHMLFRRPYTVSYPFEKPTLSPRFRGVHRLKKDAQGNEKCVACFMCATACPAACIAIVAEEAPESFREHDPTRDKRPKVFTIDMLKCIYCGMCEEACPCDAIELTRKTYPTGRTRADFIYDKQRLLDN